MSLRYLVKNKISVFVTDSVCRDWLHFELFGRTLFQEFQVQVFVDAQYQCSPLYVLYRSIHGACRTDVEQQRI